MRMRQLAPASILCLTLSVLPGCTQILEYRPIDADGSAVESWSETIDGVRFDAQGLSVSAGSHSATHRVTVTNNSTRDVVVEKCMLRTNGKTFTSTPDEQAAGFLVPPGTAEAVSFTWDIKAATGERPF